MESLNGQHLDSMYQATAFSKIYWRSAEAPIIKNKGIYRNREIAAVKRYVENSDTYYQMLTIQTLHLYLVLSQLLVTSRN